MAVERDASMDSRRKCATDVYNLGGFFMSGAARWKQQGNREQEHVGHQMGHACFELALRILPSFVEAARGLTVVASAMGDADQARHYAEQAQRLAGAGKN